MGSLRFFRDSCFFREGLARECEPNRCPKRNEMTIVVWTVSDPDVAVRLCKATQEGIDFPKDYSRLSGYFYGMTLWFRPDG